MRTSALAESASKTWLDAGLGFLYPPVCQICGEERAGASTGYVCAHCWSKDGGPQPVVPPFCERCGLPHEGEITADYTCANCREIELDFIAARAAVKACGVVLELIHRFKYNRALWFEPFIAGLLAEPAVPWLARERWNLIVPVPLHPVKEREREFNQAQRLAARLGKASGLRVEARSLRRVAATRTQTALSRTERARNVRNAFRATSPSVFENARVVLVDDVMTTGATANACAAALKKAGAEAVCVWTVARAVFAPELTSEPV